jgi:hypothetical protein
MSFPADLGDGGDRNVHHVVGVGPERECSPDQMNPTVLERRDEEGIVPAQGENREKNPRSGMTKKT